MYHDHSYYNLVTDLDLDPDSGINYKLEVITDRHTGYLEEEQCPQRGSDSSLHLYTALILI